MWRLLPLLAVAAFAAPWQFVANSELVSDPYDAVQTPDGYLWVAAGAQVHRYDGRSFETFGESHGLISRGFIHLSTGKDGALLAGTSDGLFRMEGGRFQRIFAAPVLHFTVSAYGLIAIHSEGGKLTLGDGRTWHAVEAKWRLGGQVSFDSEGGLIFGCDDGICEFSPKAIQGWERIRGEDAKQTPQAVHAGYVVYGICRDRWGRVWIHDHQRVFVADRVEGPYRRQKNDGTLAFGVSAIRLSRAGVAYIGGPQGFAIGNAKGELEWLTEGSDSTVFLGDLAYWDDQGSLWRGRAPNGLLRRDVTAPLYRIWGIAEGLKPHVFGILGLRDGRTAAGTSHGIYFLGADEKRWELEKDTLDRFGTVSAMFETQEGAILFGVNRGPPAMARLERNGKVSRTYEVPPLKADGPNVHSILPDPRGHLWLGSSRRLYKAVVTGPEVSITAVPLGSLPQGHVVPTILLDDQRRLIVPMRFGLFRLDGDKQEYWGPKDGLLDKPVGYVARHANGNYWIAYLLTAAMSVVNLNGGKATVTHVPPEIGFGPVNDLLADKRGWIWIGDDRGILVNRTGGLAPEDFQRVGEENRAIVKGINAWSLHEDDQGRIWASGNEGTIRIDDPELFVEQRTSPPPVSASGFTFSGTEGDPLQLQLHAPRLRGLDMVRYRWRLNGEWTVSNDGVVKIPAVPAGNFTFEAEAEHKEGWWRTGTLRIPVRSVIPWWRATWFWWPAGLAMVAGIGWVWRAKQREKREAAAYAQARLQFAEERKNMPVFGDRYRGVAVLGRGAFATVYRAEDETGGHDVAVKMLHVEELARKQLEREVESLRRISHPGVVGVLEYSVSDADGAYLVLDYVPGPTLREELKKGPLTRERVARLARQLGEALAAAHAAGVIHRDLKPENIILRPEGDGERAVIVDFGIAVCKPPGMTSAQATSVGGTLFYLAPEQLGGSARTSADVYSFAVILCEALTGVCPAIEEDGGLEKRAAAAAVLLEGDAAGPLICAAMDYDQARRPKDAAAFGAAVAEALS